MYASGFREKIPTLLWLFFTWVINVPAATILIVDDSAMMRNMLKRAAAASGAPIGRVLEAGNGREALEALRSGQYQLVISDWEMPEMSGLDLCREIRSRVSVSYTYFILLTARTGTLTGGINTAGVSRGFGSGSGTLDGHGTTRMQVPFGGSGSGSALAGGARKIRPTNRPRAKSRSRGRAGGRSRASSSRKSHVQASVSRTLR